MAKLPKLHESRTPAFAVRGTLPWHSYLNSAAAWDLGDYKQYIDQLIHMRFNLVAFHASNKYLLLAHNERVMRRLGRLVANHERRPVAEVFAAYASQLGEALPDAPSGGARFVIALRRVDT